MKYEKKIIVYDDYNSRIYGGRNHRHDNNQYRQPESETRVPHCGDIMGTITCNIGSPTPRNGFKIIEINCMEDKKKKCGFTACTPSEEALANRPEGRGWKYVQTEDGRRAWVRIRKLTPRECFRLMDVDEEYIDKIKAAGISDSQQYRMAGNSIVVSCMEGIFYNLFSEEEVFTGTLF